MTSSLLATPCTSARSRRWCVMTREICPSRLCFSPLLLITAAHTLTHISGETRRHGASQKSPARGYFTLMPQKARGYLICKSKPGPR